MNLVDLLKRPESKTLEFKRDFSSSEGALRSIIAFANTAGGTLLIGVEDGSRHVRGIKDPLDLEARLANAISDNIVPRLVPQLEIMPWRRTHVVAVQVYPSSTRPHYLQSGGPEDGVYVRMGASNRRADRELIDEMRRFGRGESYDEQGMPDLSSEAIDFRAASEFFASIRKLKAADLETLCLITNHQGRNVPTVGGVLLFGKPRNKYFPDAWLQGGRFRGLDRRHIEDSVEIKSYPIASVEEAIEFIQKHALRRAEIGNVRRKDRWNLPPVATREAVVNAVVHTNYAQHGAPIRIAIFDDRLEIENPGPLPFGLTLDDLPHGISKLRNRVIGRVFQELGLIEQWGSGIQRIIAACHDAGLPPPKFEEIGLRFRATIYTQSVRAPNVNETDRVILNALAHSDGLSTQEVAVAVKRSTRTARHRLLQLIAQGIVVEVGTSPQDPKRRYFLAK